MPGNWGLGAGESAARSAAHPTRRQPSAWTTLGLLFGALVVVVVLVWAVGAGCTNTYDRGTACRDTDSDIDCVKPKPGPGYYRSDQPQTTNR